MSDLADLLVVARSIWRKRDLLGLDKEMQDDAVRRLHKYGVLSITALGSIVGVTPYRVRKAIAGMSIPEARGHLNPAHLTMLLFALSQDDMQPRWVRMMIDEGTSISTISELTGISRSTLNRRKNG